MPTDELPPDRFAPVAPELFTDADDTQPFEDAGKTAQMLLLALEDPVVNFPALRALTTPESWEAWGDFKIASDFILDFPWSIQTHGERPVEDVAYIAVLRDTTDETYYVLEDAVVPVEGVITLVRRATLEPPGWRVHGVGRKIPVDQLPRDSGTA